MSGKIRLLPDLTINQIAAGEVIENPASVIKELVENAVDAGATQISIEILSGGFQWIKVSDNGSGMAPDDAVLCLERHATSKICDAADLFALTTMGFRGEALASIAAISKMTLLTALENAPAVRLEVEGGKIQHISPDARTRGTTIEVRSLFYNVPARKKFQKSLGASSAEITKVVTQLALAHPEIGFDLVLQNQSQFSLPAGPGEDLLIKRAAALLGEEFVQNAHPLEMKEGHYHAAGLIADPQYSRHNRTGQSLFVNRRPVICPSISYAVRDAYGTRLSTDRYPVYLLHLSIPPTHLDVNVHPQKKEIRLREEGVVKYLLHSAVNNALFSQRVETPKVNFAEGFTFHERPDFSVPLVLKEEEESEPVPEFQLNSEIHAIGLYRHYFLVQAESLPHPFAFGSRGVVWFDLFAVESRIHFEALLQTSGPALTQGLLIPLTLSFSRAEAQLLKGHLETIQKLGIQIREIGQTVFLIEAIPTFLEESEVQTALEEIIGELQGEKTPPERRLATCICRRVRSHRKSYNLLEASHLVKELLKAEDPFHCPQGKKTLFYIREEELESYFTRKTASSHAIETVAESFDKTKT